MITAEHSLIDTAVLADLIQRFLPKQLDNFIFESIPDENGMDAWELDSTDTRIILRGNNLGSMGAAFGHYLKHTLKANISWCGNRTDVSAGLPLPNFERRVISQKYRVYMNYCTHSYSAAWWDWDRWQFEIDMMVINGINMPLAITGTEAVWYATLLDLDFTDEQIRSFLAGPAFLAWQWMTNLEHHGGPLPMSWIEQHTVLGKRILERELAFGMHPIQQGFSGYVPLMLKEKFPESDILIKKTWNNIGSTAELNPDDPLFKKIGLLFMKHLHEIYGTYGFYAADPFHEGTPPKEGSEYLRRVGKTISSLYEAYDPGYTWVMQAWDLRSDIVKAVDPEHLLILDLMGHMPDRTEGFFGYPFIAGSLHNFGARMSLHGDLQVHADNKYATIREKYPNIAGTGLFMEGIGQNPVYYDLALDMLTRSDRIGDLHAWVHDYCLRRYGSDAPALRQAWDVLIDNIYIPNSDFVERGTILCTRPCLNLRGTGPCDEFNIHYDNKQLFRALDLLRSADVDSEGYHFDCMDLCRQLLSNYAQHLYVTVRNAFYEKNLSLFRTQSNAFLALLLDIDKLLALRKEWRLQTWIEDARSFGTTPEEEDQYECNARMQITIWGNEENSLLFDYAWKEWSGLIGTYHVPRWKKFFDMLEEKLEKGEEYDEDSLPVFENRIIWRASSFYSELADWEAQWLKDTTPIPIPTTEQNFVDTLLNNYRHGILSNVN